MYFLYLVAWAIRFFIWATYMPICLIPSKSSQGLLSSFLSRRSFYTRLAIFKRPGNMALAAAPAAPAVRAAPAAPALRTAGSIWEERPGSDKFWKLPWR